MPFIVRVLPEDVVLWEAYEHSLHRGPSYLEEKEASSSVAYRLKLDVYRPETAPITLKAPAPLESLVGQDLFCTINVEKGYLSKRTGAGRRVHIHLERLNRKLEGRPRLLRLRIARIDPSTNPPRVYLTEL